jgi:hypothetical protein
VFNKTWGRLDEVIGRLSVTQRLAVTMRKLHHLDYDAIGASLDCSAERAQAHVVQALRTIRHGLDGLGPPHGGDGSAVSRAGRPSGRLRTSSNPTRGSRARAATPPRSSAGRGIVAVVETRGRVMPAASSTRSMADRESVVAEGGTS